MLIAHGTITIRLSIGCKIVTINQHARSDINLDFQIMQWTTREKSKSLSEIDVFLRTYILQCENGY